jgi:uncharacterized protein (DUF1501 family)
LAPARSAFDAPQSILATRRSVLITAAMGLAAWAGVRSALANVTLGAGQEDGNVLVFLFLRGGADGLNMVVPYRESEYYKARPNLSIAAPNDRRYPERARAVDLDGFFGLHPSLTPLSPIFSSGELSIVHACGSNDQTRSHFEAMSTVERGAAQGHSGPGDGWLARHLMTKAGSDSPLRAVAFSETMPDSLRGATKAIAIPNLDAYSLRGGEEFESQLEEVYGGKDQVRHSGRQTIAALRSLRSLDPKGYRAENGAVYPKSDLGEALRQVACLIRGNLGLEIACLDRGGWDTHVTQGADVGWQAIQLSDVAAGIAAFHRDMGREMKRVTLVMMSEFGRRVAENAGLGTDHGRGGPMFLIGGGLRAAKVYGAWPGLAPSQLDEVGDLRVTTDYRTVLAEVLQKRMSNPNLADLFPGLPPTSLNVLTG